MPIHTSEIKNVLDNSGTRIDNSSQTEYSNTNEWIKVAVSQTPDTGGLASNAGARTIMLLSLSGSGGSGYTNDWSFLVTINFGRDNSSPYYDVSHTYVTCMPLNADRLKVASGATSFNPATDLVLTISDSQEHEYELWIKSASQRMNCFASILGAGPSDGEENSVFSLASMKLVTGQTWGARVGKDNDVFGMWASTATRFVNIREELSSTPANPGDGNGGIIYVKNDGKLYFRSNEVAETNLGTITSTDVTQVTSATSPFLIANSKVGIGTSPDATDALFNVIDTSLNALTDVGVMANYHMHIECSSPSGHGAGIAMGSSGQVGSAIIYKDTGSWGQGELQFYTKESSLQNIDPVKRLVIANDGVVEVTCDGLDHGASTGAKAFCVGARAGTNIAIDDNDIQGYNNTTPSQMWIQFYGGALNLGNNMTGGGTAVTALSLNSNQGVVRIKQQSDTSFGGIRIVEHNTDVYWSQFIDSSGHLKFAYNGGSNGGYLANNLNVSNITFTGQHWSSPATGTASDFIDKTGLIVVSTGDYNNISDSDKKPSINESLPSVVLSSKRNQKSVFGVVSDYEKPEDSDRLFSQGAWSTYMKKEEGDERLVINSLGEGAIWVCDINGDLENGDFITSCEIPGLGMRQDDDLLHNYTVAKITQNCLFDLESDAYVVEEFTHNGQTYLKAFVGCTYHCG